MALDQLHRRRLATVIKLVEAALHRIELLLEAPADSPDRAKDATLFTVAQREEIRMHTESIRQLLAETVERFGTRPDYPEPRQIVAAELSNLWVILENAMPPRMTGYGRPFDPKDREDWERIMRELLREVNRIRSVALAKDESRRASGGSGSDAD
jgi:hypothetical protein